MMNILRWKTVNGQTNATLPPHCFPTSLPKTELLRAALICITVGTGRGHAYVDFLSASVNISEVYTHQSP